jgi:hypothetical protein
MRLRPSAIFRGLKFGASLTLAGEGVVPAQADSVERAHQLHRVLRLAVLDEREDVCFRLEVNSMAFLKRSCSIFKRS